MVWFLIFSMIVPFNRSISLKGIKEVHLVMDLGNSGILITKSSDDSLRVKGRYTDAVIKRIKVKVERDNGIMTLKIKAKRRKIFSPRFWKSCKNSCIDSNFIEIELPEKPIYFIEADLSLTADSLDLSGLAIKNLSIDANLSDIDIVFGKKNRVGKSLFSFHLNLSAFTIKGLGAMRFENMNLDASLSEIEIDGTDRWYEDGHLNIDTNLSSTELDVSQNLGLYVKVTGTFNFEDIELERANGHIWISRDYRKKKRHLVIDYDGILSSFELSSD